MTRNTCTVIGCDRPVAAQKLCSKHYKQLQRHGAEKVGSNEVSAKLINGQKLLNHPLYEQWRSIVRVKQGTRVCDRWRDFENFVQDVGEKPEGSTGLYRLDQGGLFEKSNTAWRFPTNSKDRREYQRIKMREFYARNPDYARWSSMKSKYGLTKEQYEELLEKQGGVCAICGQPEMRTTKAGVAMLLHVDHCHNSGKIRGLLCHKCNSALGLFMESSEILSSAVNYLVTNQ